MKKNRLLYFKKGSILYFALIIFTLIFTQALRSAISSMLFISLMLLSVLILIYILIAKTAISVYVDTDTVRASKNSPVEYEITVINHSPVPFPFTSIIVSTPSENGVRCALTKLNIILAPFGRHEIKRRISFKYRGGYDIGINSIYVSDFFGLFQIRVSSELYRKVLVFPEKLTLTGTGNRSVTDLPTDLTKRAYGTEKSEAANIREYIPGDSLKDIHWKLSSKLQEMQVKDYNTNNTKSIYIICDTSFITDQSPKDKNDSSDNITKKNRKTRRSLLKKRRKDTAKREKAHRKAIEKQNKADIKAINKQRKEKQDSFYAKGESKRKLRKLRAEEISANIRESFNNNDKKGSFYEEIKLKPEFSNEAHELLCDGVLELALAAARREMRDGNNCTLICPDSRFSNKICAYNVDSCFESGEAFVSFSTTPVLKEKLDIGSVISAITENMNITIRYVSANIDPETVSSVCAVPSMFGGIGSGCSEDYMLFTDDSLFENPENKKNCTYAARDELVHNGISFSVYRRKNDADFNNFIQSEL